MATFQSAFNQIASTDYALQVGLIVAGVALAEMLTEVARNEIVDIGVEGGDAVYGIAMSVLALALLPRRFGRPLGTGFAVGGLMTAAEEKGVL